MAHKSKPVFLATDGSCSVPVEKLATSLNRLCKNLRFEAASTRIRPRGKVISHPRSYRELEYVTGPLLKKYSCIIVATDRRYDNNFFWESSTPVIFVSFSGWDYLTNLPKSNGMAGFVTSILAHELNDGSHHDENTGCVYDFLWDKSGIDTKLRGGAMCRACHARVHGISKKFPKKRLEHFDCTVGEGLEDFTTLLDEISLASKREIDVLKRWETKAGVEEEFDVFLCHNSADKTVIRSVFKELRRRGIRPWFDEEHLRPGFPWQDQLENTIPRIKSAAVFVGQNGQGPWQVMELKAFLMEFTRRACPVIPVILSNAPTIPQLPIFLQSFQWVDFRRSEPSPWDRLIWGITGSLAR